MVATVLDGLGFSADLTPASKDGGKDIILMLVDDDVVRTYVVELKHWRSGKRVGPQTITEFVQLVAHEGRDRGLLVATYSYSEEPFAALTEVDRSLVSLAGSSKVSLFATKVESGLWMPLPGQLPDLLFANLDDGGKETAAV